MDLTDLYTPEDIQTLLETSEQTVKEGELEQTIQTQKERR